LRKQGFFVIILHKIKQVTMGIVIDTRRAVRGLNRPGGISAVPVFAAAAQKPSWLRRGFNQFKWQLPGAIVLALCATGYLSTRDNEPRIIDKHEVSQPLRIFISKPSLLRPEIKAPPLPQPVVAEQPAEKQAEQTQVVGRLAEIPVPPKVDRALQYASEKSGMDYTFLRVAAAQESRFDTDAESDKSSACGLMQLTLPTQLGLLFKYGKEHGYGRLAKEIGYDPEARKYRIGRYHKKEKKFIASKDEALREKIQTKCFDPKFSAVMAAENSKADLRRIRNDFPGREVTYTDLYIYHLLGAPAGKRFLEIMDKSPAAEAHLFFSRGVINSNPNVFYRPGPNQWPRSLAEIYHMFARKIGTGAVVLTPPASNSRRPAPQNG
jgi:hypothetical protein